MTDAAKPRISFGPRKVTLYLTSSLAPVFFCVAFAFPAYVVSNLLDFVNTQAKQTGSPLMDTIAPIGIKAFLLFCTAAALLLLVYFLALCPSFAVFDADSGELRLRAWLRVVRRVPLDDVDTVRLIQDNEMNASRHCIIFRKELMMQPQPINLLRTGSFESRQRRGLPLLQIHDILHSHAARRLTDKSGAAENAKCGETPRGERIWKASGRYYYRWYPVFRRIILPSAAILGAVVLCDRYGLIDRHLGLMNIDKTVYGPLVIRYAYLAAGGIIALGALFLDIGLRFDPADKTLSRYRLLGLWRRDFVFAHFERFLLWNNFSHPGLYIKMQGKAPPLPLAVSRKPAVLRDALLDSARVFGVDPWENFTAHGPEAAEDRSLFPR